MEHNVIWILIGTLTFTSTLGVYVCYRKINQYFPFSQNRNVLRRRHQDIELQDVDLSSLPEYPTSQAVINHMPIRWPENSLPRYSQLSGNTGNSLPGYSQLSDNYINSPLEFENFELIIKAIQVFFDNFS